MRKLVQMHRSPFVAAYGDTRWDPLFRIHIRIADVHRMCAAALTFESVTGAVVALRLNRQPRRVRDTSQDKS